MIDIEESANSNTLNAESVIKSLLYETWLLPDLNVNKSQIKKGIKKKIDKYTIDGCIIDPEIEKKFKKEDIPIKRGGLSNAVSLNSILYQ